MSGWDWAVAAGLTSGALVYLTGIARLWGHAGGPRGVRRVHVAAYAMGVASLVLALLSPLDTLSDVLFAAHMGQHEILMLVAAPLIVAGRPLLVAAWALPDRPRRRLLAAFDGRGFRRGWRALTHPVTVLVLHAVALWIWHVPALFQWAMAHEGVHAVQHASFFLTAALFWWALVHGRYGRAGYGVAVLFVFATAMHSGVLGALLTFAGRLWYPIYDARARSVGVDPLNDQQLAGLIMWVPAGILLTVLGLGLFSAWLGDVERRGARLDIRETRP
jgi:putative membrane protein